MEGLVTMIEGMKEAEDITNSIGVLRGPITMPGNIAGETAFHMQAGCILKPKW